MKMRKYLFIGSIIICLMISGCACIPIHERYTVGCGPYPANFEEMTKTFLRDDLVYPESLKKFSVYKRPEKVKVDTYYAFIPLMEGQKVWEYFIIYDAKTKNGDYTGKTFHVAWIRHNHLIAYDYGVVDLDYSIKTRVNDVKEKMSQ